MTISLQSEQYWKPYQGISFKSLRPIAQRQIKSLFRRMESTHNHLLYKEEIKKIILYEQSRARTTKRGVKVD